MKISIGLPFYNNSKTLAITVKSILAQTYSNWELILIDDGSTDNSYEIAFFFQLLDRRIKLFSDGINRGLVFRLNQIIDISQGKYLVRMDADDIMLPNRLEYQIGLAYSNPSIDVIASAAYVIDENNYPTGIRKCLKSQFLNTKSDFDSLVKKIIHPTVFAKKSWYENNRYDENYLRAEDFELWCRTYKKSIIYISKTPVLCYREGRINIGNYIKSCKSVRKVYLNYYLGNFKKLFFVQVFLLSYLKELVYYFFGLFNLQHFLSIKRNIKISEIEKINLVNYINNLCSD